MYTIYTFVMLKETSNQKKGGRNLKKKNSPYFELIQSTKSIMVME